MVSYMLTISNSADKEILVRGREGHGVGGQNHHGCVGVVVVDDQHCHSPGILGVPHLLCEFAGGSVRVGGAPAHSYDVRDDSQGYQPGRCKASEGELKRQCNTATRAA